MDRLILGQDRRRQLLDAQGDGQRLVPIEAKASATPRPAMATAIAALRRGLGSRATPGYVVHSGDHELPLGRDAAACPLGRL